MRFCLIWRRRAQPGVDVVFLDTGYHFAETIGTRDAVAATLPVTIKTITARRTVAEQDAEFGPRLHDRNPDLCCAMRKVAPLADALAPYAAWASGLRRDEAATRADVGVVEWDEKRSMVKLNPIADLDAGRRRHATSPTTASWSTRCCSTATARSAARPCTRRLLEGEDARAGRWAGTSKVECGLHV